MKFTGVYVTGQGRGAFFVGLEGYRSQIRKLFGFSPFPGTLNVKVGRDALEHLARSPFKMVEGFTEGGVEYDACLMRPAVVKRLPAYLVLPGKTTNPQDVLEFISVFELKKELRLKPGDEVEFEL